MTPLARLSTISGDGASHESVVAEVRREEALLKTGALQNAIPWRAAH